MCFSADLESVLEEAPEIAAAALVDVPDDDEGEVQVAFVVPADGSMVMAEEVLALFQGKIRLQATSTCDLP